MEQTINSDAASQRSGIISLSNSISARQRWAQNHSIVTSILSKLFGELGIISREDISEELKLPRVKQNCHQLEKIISSINDTMNPFASTTEKEHLFNIADGKAALGETANFLTNVWTIGFSAHDCLIKDCNDDPNVYQNPIKGQKIKNFTLKLLVTKCQAKTKASFQYQRSMISLEACYIMPCKQRLQILRYPLTSMPLSMSHVGGTMQKTPKSKFLQELEKRVASNPPTNVDVTIIDGMFFFTCCIKLHLPRLASQIMC